MGLYDSIFASSVVMALAGLFCIAIPHCVQEQREAVLKCLQIRPNISSAECERALHQ